MNRYLVKIAAKKDDLKPHHKDAISKLEENDGLIVHWGTGSGKTFLFLKAIEKNLKKNPSNRALIVAPASLVTNVDKELEKHNIKIDKSKLDVYSYEKATRIADELAKNKYSIAVADEAQKLRNVDTKRTKSLSEIISAADKRLLATATANYNHSADIAPLINMAAGEKVLPEDRKEFEKRFIGKEPQPRGLVDILLNRPREYRDVIKNKKHLHTIFQNHVHYYDVKDDPTMKDKFPEVKEKKIEVEMSPEQQKYYKFVEGQMPFWLRMKIRHNLPLDKQEKAQLNSFSTGVRQVSNTHRSYHSNPESVEYSPKIEKAFESLKKGLQSNKRFKAMAYSNFLDSGVHEYSRKLTEHNIPHAVFHGGLSKDEKDRIVQDYNSGKNPVLLISSSGAEGLDLKGTRLSQLLDPHFNPAKTRQIVGRGARLESHTHLPKEEQNLEVEHYLTVHPKGLFGKAPTSIDKYLSEMSDDKAEIFSQIKSIMKDAS